MVLQQYVTMLSRKWLIHTPRGSGEGKENMEGQIELLDYLKSLEKKGFDILDYIPTGHENAVTRAYLCSATGLDDRTVRYAISQARREMPILNMQDGSGYFIPDMNLAEERSLLKRYVQQETSRGKQIFWSLMGARKTLRNCGIDWRDVS